MVCFRPYVVGMLPGLNLLVFGIVCHFCDYLVTHVDIYVSVHYHIVPFPVAACQHTEMDAEYALSETDGRIVFHALPQREMVVCVRPSEMSRQRAEGGIDVSSDKHPVHVHDIVGGQDDVQDFHESHLRETVCR